MKKRLCILVPSHWAARAGGAELQVKLLVERLTSLDAFDVHYVARNVSPSYVAEDYAIHQVHGRRVVAGSFVLDTPELLRVLGRLRPHVIYQRVAGAYTGVAAYFARRQSARMVWHVSSDRDLMPLPRQLSVRRPIERLNRYLVEYGARRAASVIVQSENQVALLRKEFGRTDAIPISNCHPAIRGPIGKGVGQLLVCWIGNVKDIKNPDAFLQLAAGFRQRADVQFVMVGAPQMDERSWQRLRLRIEGLPNVVYRGSLPHKGVCELLMRAHVLVNTSPVEGFPNTFIEAWMREVPVLSLSVNPDGVFDGSQIGVCAGGCHERLKSALNTLLADGGLRERMGRQAAVYARRRFSEANLDRVVDVLEGTGLGRPD